MEDLSDIELLVLKCRSDESRAYIAEATRCYRAGAYRAAIVSTWIAVVFDLISKIRELALYGDLTAKELEARYETYIAQIEQGNEQGIKSALEFERSIVDLCKKKLQFFDAHQIIDLERLKEDRHRCAHPSFQRAGVPYLPSAEQARLHIRNAIIHVLSLPPMQNKTALAELSVMVSSAYFPDEKDKAIDQFKLSPLANAGEALIRGFVDLLIFGFMDQQHSLFYKSQAIVALNAVSDLYPVLVEVRLDKQINKLIRDTQDEKFVGAACIAISVEPAWRVLNEVSKNKIKKFFQSCPAEEILGGISYAAKIQDLNPIIEERLKNFSRSELDKAINIHGIGNLGKSAALKLLSEVGSWESANEAFNKLIFPLFKYLDLQDIFKIIRMPTESGSDLIGAHAYQVFVDKVRAENLIDSTELDRILMENGAKYLLHQ